MVIYETINTINGKRYIGKDKNNNPAYLGSGKFLQKAIAKYGRNNFIKTILEYCDTEEQLNERERHWVTITNAQKSKLYYNIAPGGGGGDNWLNRKDSIEFLDFKNRMKIIRTRKINNTHSETTKESMRKASVGRYTLPWFISKYGEIDGDIKYNERKQFLSTRYLTDMQKSGLNELTKEKIISLIKSGNTQSDIMKMFNISHKWLYKKYREYFGTTSAVKAKNMIRSLYK